MKLIILKTELVLQLIISFGSLSYLIYGCTQGNQRTEFFIVLFIIGISNLLGFLIRISLSTSKFHRYYFFGVILFFLSLYLAVTFSINSQIEYAVYFMGIGGIIFNIYYLIYGFYVVKTIHQSANKV